MYWKALMPMAWARAGLSRTARSVYPAGERRTMWMTAHTTASAIRLA